MIDIGIAFMIGLMIGLWLKPKNKDLVEQQAIYDKKIIQYEIDLAYYKQLCKWHVERMNELKDGISEDDLATALAGLTKAAYEQGLQKK